MTQFASAQKDVYKEFHRDAYNPTVSHVYINFTSRNGKHSNVDGGTGCTFLGLQYFIKSHLIQEWNDTFFNIPRDRAIAQHSRIMSAMLGYEVTAEYLGELHDLGYLPIRIKALPEGTMVPYGVAAFTIENTHPGFWWLPNALETVGSTEIWPISTSLNTSVAYQKHAREAYIKSGMDLAGLPFAIHDFSMRGMFGKQAAAMSGFGHLASGSAGTDTIPAVIFAEQYYGANVDNELVGASVNATEHSVTCSWEVEGEIKFLEYLMEQNPEGILSVVADTWDFWDLVTTKLTELKEQILARDGKVVIRPDSGDPVQILCGLVENVDYRLYKGDAYPIELFDGAVFKGKEVTVGTFSLKSDVAKPAATPIDPAIVKGLVECLYDIFGGTKTSKGYIMLNEKIGAIYGDAITLQRQRQITERLMDKGFCPQVVLGVGSYSFQMVTRDTHGSAVKATNIVKDGVDYGIAKDPKTDRTKKSARGLLRIEENGSTLVMYDQQTREMERAGLLEVVFENGELIKETTLAEIRERTAKI